MSRGVNVIFKGEVILLEVKSAELESQKGFWLSAGPEDSEKALN